MNRENLPSEKLFFRLKSIKSENSYWKNISVLRSRPTKETFLKSIQLTNSKIARERQIGIDVLAQLGLPPRPFYSETIKQYFTLLKKERNPVIIRALLYGIGHNKEKITKSQISFLASFREHKNAEVRRALAFAIDCFDNPIAIDTLIILSGDKTAGVRDWATFALGDLISRNNKKIREALWERVNEKDQEIKHEAILGLAKRKDARISNVIKQEIIDGNFDRLLWDTIEELGDPQFIPLLQHSMKKFKNDKDISGWLPNIKYHINKIKKKAINNH